MRSDVAGVPNIRPVGGHRRKGAGYTLEMKGEAPLFCSDLHCDIGDACPCGNVPEAMEACLPVTSHSFSQSSGPVCVNVGSVHLAGEQTQQILSILFEKVEGVTLFLARTVRDYHGQGEKRMSTSELWSAQGDSIRTPKAVLWH